MTLFTIPSFSQKSFFDNSSVVTTFHYGYIWAHSKRIEHLVTGHTTGFEISLQKQTNGNKLWHVIHDYPQTGFSYIHLDFGNSAVLGQANAIVGYINFPFVKKPNFLFAFHFASGLGYLSKRYDRVENHKDLVSGSHINAAIQLIGMTRYRISKKIFFNLNYGLTHFSNGAYHVPNIGINNVSFSGGLTYQFSEPDTFYKPVLGALDNRWMFDILYAFGVKENYPPDRTQYFAHSFCFTFLKPVSYKSKLGIGGDVFYDLGLMKFIEDASSSSDLRIKMLRSGIHISYEMVVNKFTMLIAMGGYLHDRVKKDGNFYHRIGLKYELGKNFYANLGLKTHFARADFVELGAGWRFHLGKMKSEK